MHWAFKLAFSTIVISIPLGLASLLADSHILWLLAWVPLVIAWAALGIGGSLNLPLKAEPASRTSPPSLSSRGES